MKSSVHLSYFISCNQKVCPTLAVELLECTVTLCHRSEALQIPSDDPSLLPLVLDEGTRVQEYHGEAQSQQRQEVLSASPASQREVRIQFASALQHTKTALSEFSSAQFHGCSDCVAHAVLTLKGSERGSSTIISRRRP